MEIIYKSNSWSEFEERLNRLGPDSEFRKKKGDLFEELTRLYLQTDPIFATKITDIWPHSKIPQTVVDELGLTKPEIGVDLVAKIKDGTYWAIQCKYHQDRTKNVTYEELSTFFSITERKNTYDKLSHRLICTSANSVSHKVNKVHTDKVGYITALEFSNLGKEQFDAFRKVLGGCHFAPEPFVPRDHQTTAIKKCLTHFRDPQNTRGKIIHPCGSGKSLTGYWVSRKLNAKTILLTVPSLALVRQTLGSWAREAVADGITMDWIAVCSDEGVKSSDDPSMRAVDLGIVVNTDPRVIAEFLSEPTEDIKVLITTYQSGQAVSDAAKKVGMRFDLGVYDEAHKTVGLRGKVFAYLLHQENIKVQKRVFMTATERQFKGNSNDILSMDDEDIYGPIIDRLSFREALERAPPILSDYKICSAVVTTSEIEQLINNNDFVKSDGGDWTVESDASTLASLIVLRKLIAERGLKHVISFHSSIKRAQEFQKLNVEINNNNGNLGYVSSFHVSGKDSTGNRAAEIERFLGAEPSLITNARCMTEGVDIPKIDAVLFADPKQSQIDIVQAAGRALRKFEGKKFGYIIIPIVIEESDVASSNEAFKQVINVISAMGMGDDRIVEEFKLLVSGRRGQNNIVEFDFPNVATSVNFQEFLSDVEILIWDRLSFAKSVVGESEFARWMKESKSLSEKTRKNYSQAIRKISNDLIRLKLAYGSLEELMESEDLYKLKEEYFEIPEYKELDIRGKSMYSAGFNRLIEFHQSRSSTK